MHTPKKFWLVVGASIAAFVLIACSCSGLPSSIQNILSTPTTNYYATLPPVQVTEPPIQVTEPPIDVQPSGGEPMPGLAGDWIDPDSSGGGTVSTIVWQNNEYQVVSVINSNRGPNELTKSTWAEGVLTWEYCPEGMHCITQSTVSLHGDALTVNWSWSDGGNSGTSDLMRYNP